MSVFGHPDQDADVGVIERTLEQWKALCEYARIGTEKPPEHVFVHFQRLHGLPETGAPEGDDDPFAALARLATRLDEQGKMAERIEGVAALACDLLQALQPWDFQRPAVRSACTRLTVALAAMPLPAAALGTGGPRNDRRRVTRQTQSGSDLRLSPRPGHAPLSEETT